MEEFQFILAEVTDYIATVTINRPEVLNAINGATWEELGKIMAQAERDPAVRVIIVRGAGERAFSAGADLRWLGTFSALTVEETPGPETCKRIQTLGKPVLAAVDGYALGGGLELAMACDLRIATDRAKLGQPEINWGIIPGAGGTQRLPRLVGIAKAKELVFTGDTIDAQEALAIGLVNRVVRADQLMPTVRAIAAKIASKAPHAIRLAKAAIELGMGSGLQEGLKYERAAQAILFGTDDGLEGMAAFREKRQPVYKGR